MICPSCQTENPAGSRFCGGCGAALSRVCDACGAANDPAMRFCTHCGSALAVDPASDAPQRLLRGPSEPETERRLVSVLFADLVGFTTLSESRDAEDVRELLSRYFDLARTLIERYGGTVEKFIGDAVMAVWGTPTATEDDAERAVRAALDLVASVAELEPTLRARAGVLTGEAAVTVGGDGEGMVAGDLVNTASRIQSSAEPEAVLVGESTRRATEQVIVYESAGEHELKGKAEPVAVWRALRVVSGLGGTVRTGGLEPPFVGRERELRLIKERFHACADEGKAHLVSVTGIAGIGKSRLAWEFYKYFDGIVELVWWHRGRCLAYGEGVAYWALADMVRMRARIAEDETPASAREKLRATVEEHVPDPQDRAYVEPRLAQLLGLEEQAGGDRQELFAAWRLFFERIAAQGPCVLAFEDLQWADAGLLDFVEYLLEWSRDFPLYVITLARPELHERRPGWGAGLRNFTSLYLEPLSEEAMNELLEGLVPGLPDGLRGDILARAEGVPLYAVETVRMLLDRGLVAPEGAVYRPLGAIETLAVPETLHALIAARLDALSAHERRVLQDAAVLGKTFTIQALAALSRRSDDELEPVLASLVRKDVLGIQSDPRSPEHGQYGFLQDLVRRVAYETLARRERKARHLAAAEHLQQAFAEEDEVVEVVASHYLAAYEAAPDANDARAIQASARDALERAGDRATSLFAHAEGERYFERAAALAAEPARQAELRERAGLAARLAGRLDAASEHYGSAIALFETEGLTHAAARVSARLGDVDYGRGQLAAAIERMEGAFDVLSEEERDADFAALAAQLGRLRWLNGDLDGGLTATEAALDVAEALRLPALVSDTLNTKGSIVSARGHVEEGLALTSHALEVALDADISSAALRAYNNLAFLVDSVDRVDDSLALIESAVELARRVGDRVWEWTLLAAGIHGLGLLGRWEDAFAELRALLATDGLDRSVITPELFQVAHFLVLRGNVDDAEALLQSLQAADPQAQLAAETATASLLRARGRAGEALQAGERAFAARGVVMGAHAMVKLAFVEAAEAALELGDVSKAESLLAEVEALPRAERTPFYEASVSRFRARILALRGEEDVDRHFKRAAGQFRELAMPYWLAAALAEHAEWLSGQGGDDEAEPLFAEAREIFERLGARPWLERLEREPLREPTAGLLEA
jgi:class 3 adenylate cyclase/tetratricopeptide (TPR) repeat protein